MNNSNSINTPLHVVNFVASQSNFAFTMNLLFWGSINYTCCRFTFAALHAGDELLRPVKEQLVYSLCSLRWDYVHASDTQPMISNYLKMKNRNCIIVLEIDISDLFLPRVIPGKDEDFCIHKPETIKTGGTRSHQIVWRDFEYGRGSTDIPSWPKLDTGEMQATCRQWPECSTDYTAGVLVTLGNTSMGLLRTVIRGLAVMRPVCHLDTQNIIFWQFGHPKVYVSICWRWLFLEDKRCRSCSVTFIRHTKQYLA